MSWKIFFLFLCFHFSYGRHDDWEAQRDYPCWSKKFKWHYKGLVKAPFYTLESCQRYCVSLEDCFVVDYDVGTNPPCWTQIPGQKINLLTEMKAHPRCDNYLLDRNCLEPRIVPYSTEMCWSQREFHGYHGLDAVKEITSLGSCLNYCAALPDCNIVDFFLGPEKATCWVQRKGKINPSKFYKGIQLQSNYILNRECMALFDEPFVYNIELCWERKVNTAYKNNKNIAGKSITECLNYCLDNGCELVDFDIAKDEPCWVKMDDKPITASLWAKSETCVNYKLDDKCGN